MFPFCPVARSGSWSGPSSKKPPPWRRLRCSSGCWPFGRKSLRCNDFRSVRAAAGRTSLVFFTLSVLNETERSFPAMHLPSITASYHVGAEASPRPRVGAGLGEPPRACRSLLIRRFRRGDSGARRVWSPAPQRARARRFVFAGPVNSCFSHRVPRQRRCGIPCPLQQAVVNNNANTMARLPGARRALGRSH